MRSVATLVVLAAVAGVLVAEAAVPLDNLDTYFHLRFGHEFLSGDWSLRDPGSVSSLATADWVPTQWLSEVVMAKTEDWFGLAGVAWLSGLLFLSLALVVYWACRRQAEPAVAALLVVLTLIACTSGISMRPQMVSYILVVVTIAAGSGPGTPGGAPWLLVPADVGLDDVPRDVAGRDRDRHGRGARARPRPRSSARRTWPGWLAVPVLSAAVSLLTPVGPGLFPAVLRVGSRAKYFYEWSSAGLHQALGRDARRSSWRWPWCRDCGAPSGCRGSTSCCSGSRRCGRSTRCAPCRWRPAWPPRSLRPPCNRSSARGPRCSGASGCSSSGGYVLALATLAVLVPHTADEPRDTPPWLDGALGDLPAGTRVINDSGFGGYLMWRFPQLDVVMHGYGDLYTDDELERNADIEGVRAGWVEPGPGHRREYAVLPPDSPLAYNLREVEGWTVVEHGADLELLRAPPGWIGRPASRRSRRPSARACLLGGTGVDGVAGPGDPGVQRLVDRRSRARRRPRARRRR